MPYSDDILRARIEELEKRVDLLDRIVEAIASGQPWAVARGAQMKSGRFPLEPVITIPVKR